MVIDKNFIKKLEALSKIELSEIERNTVENDLKEILDYMTMLDEIDLDDLNEEKDIITNILREDIVTNENSIDAVLSNAPNKENGYFKVPKTVE